MLWRIPLHLCRRSCWPRRNQTMTPFTPSWWAAYSPPPRLCRKRGDVLRGRLNSRSASSRDGNYFSPFPPRFLARFYFRSNPLFLFQIIFRETKGYVSVMNLDSARSTFPLFPSLKASEDRHADYFWWRGSIAVAKYCTAWTVMRTFAE